MYMPAIMYRKPQKSIHIIDVAYRKIENLYMLDSICIEIPPQPSLFQREGVVTHFAKGGRRRRGDLLFSLRKREGWGGIF